MATGTSGARALTALRGPRGRTTNLTLFLVLSLAFATGGGAVATGSPSGRWVVVAHGIVGLAVVLLVPWKGRVVRRGLRRVRPSRWLSLLLMVLTVTTLLAGIGYGTGIVRSAGDVTVLWLHVAAALALVPLLLWHAVARPARPRRADLSRRNALRLGLLGAAAATLYVTTTAAVAVTGLPGARRRFTGSYDTGSFDPAAMPNTIWLDDTAPAVDADRWRLHVVTTTDSRSHTLDDLAAARVPLRATLDCTSGWYAEQDWAGVPVSALLPDVGSARSVLVHSASGYQVRFPVGDLDRLLLATHVGGAPLSRGHGYPLRLVAPDRRGFWWVKWVDRIELQDAPAWWQPPFPLS